MAAISVALILILSLLILKAASTRCAAHIWASHIVWLTHMCASHTRMRSRIMHARLGLFLEIPRHNMSEANVGVPNLGTPIITTLRGPKVGGAAPLQISGAQRPLSAGGVGPPTVGYMMCCTL